MGTIKEHSTTIDGKTYTTRTLPASAGLVILPKIIALCGDALAGLFLTTDDEQRAALLDDPAIVGKVLAAIAERAAENDGLLVLRDMLAETTCEQVSIGDAEVPGNVGQHFDTHFAGVYAHLVKVCLWVGKCNFTAP